MIPTQASHVCHPPEASLTDCLSSKHFFNIFLPVHLNSIKKNWGDEEEDGSLFALEALIKVGLLGERKLEGELLAPLRLGGGRERERSQVDRTVTY